MKRWIPLLVVAVVSFALGWVAHPAQHSSTSQENADQVAAVVMTTRLQAPEKFDTMVGSAYELRTAKQICQTRLHLSPQVPELHDTQECAYRMVEWSHWWNQMARDYSRDATQASNVAASPVR